MSYSEGSAAVAPKKVQEKSPLDPDNFIDFKLKKVIPYNHNTSTFVFELPDNQSSMLPVASCVVTKSDTLLDDKGKPVIRPYTPITPSDKQGELSILIKKYDTGKMSKHIFEMKVRAADCAWCQHSRADRRATSWVSRVPS